MGGRPAKAVAVSAGKIGKEKIAERARAEAALRGSSDKLCPPEWLNSRRKEVFCYVLDELETGGILGNVDVFVLTQFAVSVDRLEYIEQLVNGDSATLWDKGIMTTKAKYMEDFKTGLRELSLSPQARAKLGGLALNKKQEESDPLLTLLRGKGRSSSA